nr:MAG TPA: hypothetical protein [Caudoviricetes sp.]
MSDEQMEAIAEVLEMVDKAQAKGKFKLEEVIKGVGFPEDIVDIYLDSESAYKLSKVNDLIISTVEPEALAKYDAQAEELKAKILKSRLRFYMRGIDQKQIEALEAYSQELNKDNEDDDLWLVDYMCALVAANVYKVEDADGNIDDSVFNIEDARKWRGSLPTEGWNALQSSMQKLSLATGYFKGLTDAGFLPKS